MEALHKERNELQVGTKAKNSYALITTEKPKSFEEQCKSLWCSKKKQKETDVGEAEAFTNFH